MSTTQPIPPGEPAGSPVRGPAPRRSPAGVRAQFYGQPLTGRRAWAAEKLRVTAAKATAADAKKRAKAAPGDEPLPQPKISLMACDRRTLT
ncbi:MAG: hypothetical protein HOV66_00825, partial [Streptomycetaceae bacterium]|nr:hypothetical protein [Streptomycetaceae bacterium]